MPVFFLFDAQTLLSRDTIQFSDGNLAAANPNVGTDAAFLESIPFEKVYHDGPLADPEKRKIIYHRHAEVLVRDELDLDALKWIVCRSGAELRTLRQLLSVKIWNKQLRRVKKVQQLFFQRWAFVEMAELEQQTVTIQFNRNSITPGPFVAFLEIKNLETGDKYHWKNDAYLANDVLTVRIPQLANPTPYEAILTLDGAIAYADTFELESIPF